MARPEPLPGLLLVLFTSLLAVVGFAFTLDEPAGATGGPHPAVDGMQVGASTSEPLQLLGALFGFLLLAALSALLAFGLRRGAYAGWTVFVALALAYAGLLYADANASSNDPTGLPRPTAWMLYALWPAQLLATAHFLRERCEPDSGKAEPS